MLYSPSGTMTERTKKNTEISPVTDLKSIGNVLKSKREELSYTLEHVSEITKINQTCLRDIEEGKLDKLSGLVFVKGFIRNYAKLLGMDSDWMIEALDQAYAFNKSKTVSNNMGFNEMAKTHNMYLFFGLIVLIVAMVGFLYWNSNFYMQPSSNIETIEPVQKITDDNPISDTAVTQLNDSLIGSTEEKESIETAVTRIIYPLNLVLVANSDDWIRLAIDGQEATEILLTKGQKLEWPADEEYDLTMTTGNSATIHLNGEEIEVSDSVKNQLFRMKLNRFSLTQLNN